ncbi:hypothetical protein TRAPUB_10761 [Trametes pubescens]|uniref:Uncharacterized protein n=1 Tax=Trametes pubescens TaxID=154538 RepID=A0A1M2VYT3_TRAPU|nr:hypothetical protein TRAPUB_10761 [Trametes pubescens]
MASIFRIKTGDHHPIRWEDFVRSMNALGFDYYKDVGSKRTFERRCLGLKHKFKWNEVCADQEAQ